MDISRALAPLGISIAGCVTLIAAGCTVGGDGGSQGSDDDPILGASAGGETNIVSDGWPESPVRFGDNVKSLNFRQLKAEVARVTGIASYDWGNKGIIFGEADFRTSFRDDRTPSATKLIALRKVAFDVCARMMQAEATTPRVFTALSPTAALNAQDPRVAAQVTLVFSHFFLEEPTTVEVEASTQALVAQVAAGASPSGAWTGLCTGYMSSMRFLSY